MKVFLHTRAHGSMSWKNEGRTFLRLPVVGEYVCTDETSEWYEVQLVVHCPFEAQYAAEVFCVQVDHLEVKKAAFSDAM